MHKAIKSVLDHGSRGLSRRSAIKAGGAVLATGAIVAVGVSAAKADTGDARLKALAGELTQAEREYEQASALANDAHAKLPDWVKALPFIDVGLNAGGGGFIQYESNLETIEKGYQPLISRMGGDDGIVEAIKHFIEGRKAEFQRHRARADAHKRQCGYTALQKAADRAIEPYATEPICWLEPRRPYRRKPAPKAIGYGDVVDPTVGAILYHAQWAIHQRFHPT